MGRGGPLQNKDQVLIALLVILYSPISPMGLILGLAARALGTVWLLCKSGSFRGARFETTEGLIKVSALGLVAGPVLTLCLPICVMFFGFNTFIVSYYQARAQEPPLFFQKYEWRGPPGRTGGHHRKQVNNLETSSECEGDGISYQYEPLREEHDIRVLEIHPGSPDDDLQVSLGLANLTHHPLFDALSYTWADESGDARRSVPVTVHSSADSPAGTSGLPIFLTPNCAAAMRRLRRRYAARPVWIDAVCIDQAGKAERTHQVSLMARIYTQARQVVVYTGEANLSPVKLFAWLEGLDGRSLDVPVLMRRLRLLTPFQTMNSVVDDAIHLLRLATGGDSSSFLTDPSVVKSSLSISPSELQELIHDFISRRWFSRVWVVQELALVDVRNTVVLAGDEEVSAVRVMHAVSLLQSDHYSASVKGNDAIDIFVLLARGALGTYYGSGNGQRYTASHLLDMLIATRAHASEDPRDKIFAVLSIAREWDDATFIRGRSDSHRERLPAADYSLSTHEVFTRFSVHFIREHGVGFFLSLIKSPPQVRGLPSGACRPGLRIGRSRGQT